VQVNVTTLHGVVKPPVSVLPNNSRVTVHYDKPLFVAGNLQPAGSVIGPVVPPDVLNFGHCLAALSSYI
jgi:hypothetical protein